MILLKDPHPILTVRILRATLCLASLITLVGLAGYVLHLLIEWFAWGNGHGINSQWKGC